MPGSHEKEIRLFATIDKQLAYLDPGWSACFRKAVYKLATNLRGTANDASTWHANVTLVALIPRLVEIRSCGSHFSVSTDEMTSSALAFLNWVDYLLHVTCTWWDNTVKLRYFRTNSKFPPMKGKHKAQRERSTNMKKLLKVCAFLRVGCFPS